MVMPKVRWWWAQPRTGRSIGGPRSTAQAFSRALDPSWALSEQPECGHLSWVGAGALCQDRCPWESWTPGALSPSHQPGSLAKEQFPKTGSQPMVCWLTVARRPILVSPFVHDS